MKLENIKLLTDIATAWIGVIALVAAGIFSIQQYFDKKSDDRVKETLNFLDRYYKDPFWNARVKLSGAWAKHESEEDKLLDSSTTTAKEINNFLLKVIEDEHLEDASAVVSDFYSALDSCVEEGLCDRETAKQFFYDDAVVYYHRGYPYIMKQREYRKNTGFSSGLEHFAHLK